MYSAVYRPGSFPPRENGAVGLPFESTLDILELVAAFLPLVELVPQETPIDPQHRGLRDPVVLQRLHLHDVQALGPFGIGQAWHKFLLVPLQKYLAPLEFAEPSFNADDFNEGCAQRGADTDAHVICGQVDKHAVA